ncbi:hypothetical protein WAI453_002238 [Rhynchosporium graminicola]
MRRCMTEGGYPDRGILPFLFQTRRTASVSSGPRRGRRKFRLHFTSLHSKAQARKAIEALAGAQRHPKVTHSLTEFHCRNAQKQTQKPEEQTPDASLCVRFRFRFRFRFRNPQSAILSHRNTNQNSTSTAQHSGHIHHNPRLQTVHQITNHKSQLTAQPTIQQPGPSCDISILLRATLAKTTIHTENLHRTADFRPKIHYPFHVFSSELSQSRSESNQADEFPQRDQSSLPAAKSRVDLDFFFCHIHHKSFVIGIQFL